MKIEIIEGKKRKVRKFKRWTPKGKKRVVAERSLAKLKKDLDAVVSRYVRHFWSYEGGICYCYTCNRPMEIKKAQCGHFVPRSYLATRWELDNLRPQCSGCNIWGRGQLLDFEENLKMELGDVRVEELKQLRNELRKPDRHFYEVQIALFTENLANLADKL